MWNVNVEKGKFIYDLGIFTQVLVLMACNKDTKFENHTRDVGSWNRGPGADGGLVRVGKNWARRW